MTNVIYLGMILAIVGFAVYITRAWTSAENKNAALEQNSKAADEALRKLNEEKLSREYDLRKYEQDNIDRARSGPDGGTPLLLSDEDKNRLN